MFGWFDISPKKSKRPSQSQKKNVFGKKGFLSRKKLIYELGEGSMKIPETSRWYNRKETKKFLDELFSDKKYGSDITVEEARKVLKGLKKKRESQGWPEKFGTEKRIKWLEKGLDDLENKK